jgi:CDGSH iron-sulfur domain-containing protein 3
MDLPKCPQASPYIIEAEEGKSYYWCTCGLSAKQPFCDGSHKGTGMKSHCFTATKTGRLYLCGCKKTKKQPFCDGSHSGMED